MPKRVKGMQYLVPGQAERIQHKQQHLQHKCYFRRVKVYRFAIELTNEDIALIGGRM